MTATRQQTTIDPLRIFIGKRARGLPVPLVATSFDVVIDGGLAVVTASRIFRNAESSSIEATITFPVPVHASLFALKIRIGERVLGAHARRKDAARQTYEDALDRGRTAVLHEEVLRGVHMLSVGHLAPGAEIAVTSSFAASLTHLGDRATLRIPLTVGDIYGASPLSDVDDLVCGDTLPDAELTVACRDGSVKLIGGMIEDSRARIALNAPIDLEVTGWTPHDLTGRAADGRNVALRIAPTPGEELPLDTAILVDRSGSMAEPCTDNREAGTKHDVVVAALRRIAEAAWKSDRIDLWEFANVATFVGSTRPGSDGQADLTTLAQALNSPHGGTEIGRALDRVLSASSTRNLLLITDRKSHALDVQALVRRSRRISVVLVGEDSLEANVGHLAALSGGEIFVATGSDLIAAIESAVRALRIHSSPPLITGSLIEQVELRRGAMTLTARWRQGDAIDGDALFHRAVTAMAASLALPAMADESAAAFAEAEGLVTPLTSLILVDEETTQDDAIPATRKIALPAPRTLSSLQELQDRLRDSLSCANRVRDAESSDAEALDAKPTRNSNKPSRTPRLENLPCVRAPKPKFLPNRKPSLSLIGQIRYIALRIRWEDVTDQLQNGDLAALASPDAKAIRALAGRQAMIDMAAKYAIDPVLLVIALMAFWSSESSAAAAATCRGIFGTRPIDTCLEAIEAIQALEGFEAHPPHSLPAD
ncbi:MAG: VWA domain-containing protein [Alphaproteobacteria bacterium]|nr:VWA domain-containing protein [Alphaproteobacteria bacterium]